jgi:hypothetical protein
MRVPVRWCTSRRQHPMSPHEKQTLLRNNLALRVSAPQFVCDIVLINSIEKRKAGNIFHLVRDLYVRSVPCSVRLVSKISGLTARRGVL